MFALTIRKDNTLVRHTFLKIQNNLVRYTYDVLGYFFNIVLYLFKKSYYNGQRMTNSLTY
jgi:hypothetical protein